KWPPGKVAWLTSTRLFSIHRVQKCDKCCTKGVENSYAPRCFQRRVMKPLALLLAFGFSASTGRVVNFDNGTVGKTPAGWSVAMTDRGDAPQWLIMKDLTAPTQPYVLAQTSHDPKDNRCPLAIFD